MPIKQKPCYSEELPAAQVILADITSEKAHHLPSVLAQILNAKKFPTSLMKRKQSRCTTFCFAVKKNKQLGQLTFQQEHTQTKSFGQFIGIITENYNEAEWKQKTHEKQHRTKKSFLEMLHKRQVDYCRPLLMFQAQGNAYKVFFPIANRTRTLSS